MSFYLDDDEDQAEGFVLTGRSRDAASAVSSTKDDVSAAATSNNAEHGALFVCDNCGGTESYLDDTSGGLVCVDCFTQSQTIIAASQELMDYDESMALAGRVSGHLKASRQSGRGGGGSGKAKKRKRLADLDQSTPLPTVEHCILGMQRLLKEITTAVAKLVVVGDVDVDVDGNTTNTTKQNSDIRTMAMETTRTVWKAYLSSWMEGADEYAALYPEVRFCFRDLFLSPLLRMKLLRVLTHEASKKVRAELQQQEQEQDTTHNASHPKDTPSVVVKTETNGTETMMLSDDDEEADDGGFPHPEVEIIQRVKGEDDGGGDEEEDDISRSVTSVVSQATTDKFAAQMPDSTRTPIGRMLVRHRKLLRKRMTMGRKAVALSLSPSLQMVAAIVCIAFSPFGITCANMQVWIENGTLPLLNAFPLLTPQEQKRLQRIKGFFRLHEPLSALQLEKLVANLQVACGYEPKTLLLRTLETKHKIPQPIVPSEKNKKTHQGRVFTPRSLPLVLARIISQLGLSQKVLDYSLALMGLPILVSNNHTTTTTTKKSGGKEKGSLQLPKPLKACRSDRVVGMPELLGVVVTASRFIRQWEDHWYVVPSTTTTTQDDTKATEMASQMAEVPRFVPWNEEAARHLGSFSKEHLDVLENNLITVEQSIFFNDGLDTSSPYPDKQASSSIGEQETTHSASAMVVRPCLTLLKAAHDHRPPGGRAKKRKMHNNKLTICGDRSSKSTEAMVPSPPFGTFVEYVSAKTGTQPNEVLRFCRTLEKEMYRKNRQR
jgi:hypothetical protein